MLGNTIYYVGFILVTILKNGISEVDFETLDTQLRKHFVVPEILATSPKVLATVKWPSGAEAHLGNSIPFEDIKEEPEVHWDSDPTLFYSMLFTDYDDPEGEHWDPYDTDIREYHTWFVFNIPGDNVSQGFVQHPYILPTVNKTKVPHRIAVSVIEQCNDFIPNATTLFRPPRFYFSIRDVIEEYVGRIHAGNCFVVNP